MQQNLKLAPFGPDVYKLARTVINKAIEKYDLFLTDELLSADYAASKLDADGAFNTIRAFLSSILSTPLGDVIVR